MGAAWSMIVGGEEETWGASRRGVGLAVNSLKTFTEGGGVKQQWHGVLYHKAICPAWSDSEKLALEYYLKGISTSGVGNRHSDLQKNE
ncbi:hypothetical protein AVEN_158678-1 [Araneus ventricosus]|uniref:Uncharacterized protein n=1 Tax=Araneus ventricosus TaxID=182803 RepID=A0A4Y2FWN4_ARAVE|nr:hypothetical protein AVEN_158678-1 [Araneus ventricosus]